MARPRRQVYTMNQYLDNEREGYITNNVSIQRFPAWKPIVDGLAVTILTDDYIPPIILAEDGSGRTVIVDGGSRTTAFKMIRYGNYKIKSSVENPVVKYKRKDKDENGKPIWVDAEFDIRNKTYEQFPKELQKKFNEYQVETVIHECDEDTINMYFRRYNIHTCMNANQKMFIYIPKFAEKIRQIIKRDFFLNNSDFSDVEKDKGVLERSVAESIMCMFHIDKWNKNGKKLATYVNENASEEEFNKLGNNIERLENIITDTTKTLFNSKDCFIWLTLFEKFTQVGLDDSKFTEFLNAFIGGLRDKAVDGKLFDTVDETGSTKDKSVIIDKLHILETLMKDYLHIKNEKNNESEDTKKENMQLLKFIKENVRDDVNLEDIEFYKDCLSDWTVGILGNAKILEERNRDSLIAITSYAVQKELDDELMINWFADYNNRHNTYLNYQSQNYEIMLKDLDKFIEKIEAA